MGRLSARAMCRQKVQEDRKLQGSLYDGKYKYLDKTGLGLVRPQSCVGKTNCHCQFWQPEGQAGTVQYRTVWAPGGCRQVHTVQFGDLEGTGRNSTLQFGHQEGTER